MSGQDALAYAENMEFAGNSDWRLPDAKELQSLVDYTRSPATTGSAAIDPLFSSTQITNEAGEDDFPFYWSSTTHANWTAESDGAWGAYVSFGRAMGNMSDMMLPGDEVMPGDGDVPGGGDMPEGPMPTDPANPTTPVLEANWIDVHGAGAQRSDPKAGDPSEYSEGNGPQGDAVRIYNYVRLVRNVD
ncbi:MAG: DUF1566 domain-containing protein [Bacteroidales bacterium]|nr:DUF1566 domain-containing protein [Bacteroidales bacterium]